MSQHTMPVLIIFGLSCSSYSILARPIRPVGSRKCMLVPHCKIDADLSFSGGPGACWVAWSASVRHTEPGVPGRPVRPIRPIQNRRFPPGGNRRTLDLMTPPCWMGLALFPSPSVHLGWPWAISCYSLEKNITQKNKNSA